MRVSSCQCQCVTPHLYNCLSTADIRIGWVSWEGGHTLTTGTVLAVYAPIMEHGMCRDWEGLDRDSQLNKESLLTKRYST